jgi:glycosyltransferase involved in cell wall biosynthesis
MADARIVVIVPARNEAGSITALIERVPFGPRSVVVADNGSTDGTADLARQAGARVAHAPRRGYGQACLAGLAADPDVDIVVFLDADLSEDPEEMLRLVNPILADDADLVLGTRSGGSRPWHARIGTRMCVALINGLWGTRYEDLGPFRAVRGSDLRALGMQDHTWGWTIEMQVKAAQLGLRTIEIPVSSGPRAAGRSKISGSLVGSARAAWRMLEIIGRLRLTRGSRYLLVGGHCPDGAKRFARVPLIPLCDIDTQSEPAHTCRPCLGRPHDARRSAADNLRRRVESLAFGSGQVAPLASTATNGCPWVRQVRRRGWLRRHPVGEHLRKRN